jgi:hypothetical protein
MGTVDNVTDGACTTAIAPGALELKDADDRGINEQLDRGQWTAGEGDERRSEESS